MEVTLELNLDQIGEIGGEHSRQRQQLLQKYTTDILKGTPLGNIGKDLV